MHVAILHNAVLRRRQPDRDVLVQVEAVASLARLGHQSAPVPVTLDLEPPSGGSAGRGPTWSSTWSNRSAAPIGWRHGAGAARRARARLYRLADRGDPPDHDKLLAKQRLARPDCPRRPG